MKRRDFLALASLAGAAGVSLPVPYAFAAAQGETSATGAMGAVAAGRPPRHDRERDALLEVARLAVPRAEQRRAHRARPLALRPEHVAVDDERLPVAEQLREIARAALALEAVAARHLAARRQRAPQRGHPLDVPAQLDLLDEQRGARAAHARDARGLPARREIVACRIAGARIVKAQHPHAVVGQALGERANHLVRPQRLMAERLADHGAAPRAALMQPSQAIVESNWSQFSILGRMVLLELSARTSIAGGAQWAASASGGRWSGAGE